MTGPAREPGTDRYAEYEHLRMERPSDGVLLITMDRPEVQNAMNERLHQEIGRIWADVDADPATRVAVLTGAGERFSMGGERSTIDAGRTFRRAVAIMREMSDLAYSMTNCEKPIVSAINGSALAGGVAAGLLADITVMAEDAWLSDGHTRGGLVAGDHAVMLWPLLCSLSKAKYYLMTGDKIDGREAERIGLVTFAVPTAEVLPRALAIADKLANGSQIAIRWTKRSLNHWMRQAAPAFEHSMALEVLSFMGDDAAAWSDATLEGRRPDYPSKHWR